MTSNSSDTPLSLQVEFESITHGTFKDGDLATLIVLKYAFKLRNKKQHIKKAVLAVNFVLEDNVDSFLEIDKIEPCGTQNVGPGENKGEAFAIELSGRKENRSAKWIIEDRHKANGIPTQIRVAIILRRTSNRKFQMKLRNNVKVGPPERNYAYSHDTSMVPTEQGQVEPFRDSPRDMGFDYSELEPSVDGFYVEIWNVRTTDDIIMPINSPGLANDVKGFEGLQCSKVEPQPLWRLLESKFPWSDQNRHIEEHTGVEQPLEIRNSHQNGAQNTSEQLSLFDPAILNLLEPFFGLPQLDHHSLNKDWGSYQDLACRNKLTAYLIQTPVTSHPFWTLVLVLGENSNKGAAVIQTNATDEISRILLKVKQRANKKQGNRHPMFLLYCLLESHDLITGEKLSRVSDSVENVDEELARELDQKESLEDGGDRKPANQNIWHRLVRRKLKNAGNSRQKGTHGCDFGQLSRNLHQARMDLVELDRRSQFEKIVLDAFQTDLKDYTDLNQQVNSLRTSSARQRSSIESLPKTIESQRSLLYSLIARRDATLQYRLAKETSRDSKAMKTLAIITIIFLPGTFVSTLFGSDGMIHFQDGQKGWIYAVVVIPVTFVLMIAWIIWNNMKNPYTLDEEKGAGNVFAQNSYSKEAKRD
ncbi:hypothetical protein F4806DRAFT_499678 [Annulohypoxylon nitens]|nr:hypothetical protein F4806DRAFT_499678 [Annulohypoxylon nitens]